MKKTKIQEANNKNKVQLKKAEEEVIARERAKTLFDIVKYWEEEGDLVQVTAEKYPAGIAGSFYLSKKSKAYKALVAEILSQIKILEEGIR